MKNAINNNGIEVQVSNDTVVNLVNGINYLLTPEEQQDYNARVASFNSKSAERELNKIYELRRIAYGDYTIQLDMQYHDLISNTTTWKDHVAAVKLQYPLPN